MCLKQIALYNAVAQEDMAAIQSRGVQLADPVELARLLNFEMIAAGRGNQLVSLLQVLSCTTELTSTTLITFSSRILPLYPCRAKHVCFTETKNFSIISNCSFV